jgi:hypothetical protein
VTGEQGPGPTSKLVPDSVINELTASGAAHPVFRINNPALQALAGRLLPLLEAAKTHEERDPLDYLLGALDSLFRAKQLKFVDRAGPLDDAYWKGPVRRAFYMQEGDVRTDGLWLAGLHFNSALTRIAAGFDRVVRLIEQRSAMNHRKKFWERLQHLGLGKWNDPDFVLSDGSASAAYRVYAEVNFLKHDPKGRAEGRDTSFADALAALGEILDLVESRVSLSGRAKP